jgi:membrane protein DedA with SNARE-associated domain
MENVLHILEHHGYFALIALVFLEAVGLPIPAAIALAGAGAAAAWKVMSPGYVVLFSVLSILVGDSLLFFMGRKTGWWLLGFLCRVALNPETCILRSAESFYKRGRMTLLFAKFVPGINTMAPPLAGSMRMSFSQFLRFDTAGAFLYVLAYAVGGFVFSRVIKDVIRIFQTVGHTVASVAGIVLVGYIVYRIWIYWTHRVYRVVPRVLVEEVEQRIEAGEDLVILDVRSHGYYDAGAQRIRGSQRFEPNNLEQSVKTLPQGKLIFLYCT